LNSPCSIANRINSSADLMGVIIIKSIIFGLFWVKNYS
jgi:hypothetical protein